MFIPKAIYFEEKIKEYELGKQLLDKYKDIPKYVIENHNNILEMRNQKNSKFTNLKKK